MYLLILLSLVGAAIGWFTNFIAIKLLFRPYKKIRILGIEIQGLIPKRRYQIAKNIGSTVENQLLSSDDLIDMIKDATEDVYDSIKDTAAKAIEDRLPDFLPKSIKKMISSYIVSMLNKDSGLFESIIEQLAGNTGSKLKIAETVEQKINSLDLHEIEKLIINVSSKELKHIEILGGIIGFLVGLVQGVIVLLINS